MGGIVVEFDHRVKMVFATVQAIHHDGRPGRRHAAPTAVPAGPRSGAPLAILPPGKAVWRHRGVQPINRMTWTGGGDSEMIHAWVMPTSI
ncbi:MAG: hypothetical protein DWQ31_06310 [Planctomycetota bacterium]|nr:MAG: hypothetical protein DWQ31_06310 [Planctomycetota bacterium]REJ98620.1 MAG: hypothetical protein DWQ35_01065 [Planctomycetota bacterium]REK29920.1 MAG: hypothetical protein DWQ42_03185 [Planctomycetota bacterium]REK47910.1 MAG: hypothetical protein DWQ46_03175 [Planctomycetota bacterium]